MNEEIHTYLEVTCQATPDRRMLNLCRLLSKVTGGAMVHIQATRGADTSGFTLRTRASKAAAQDIWPRLRARLRENELLESCEVKLRSSTPKDVLYLWPAPGE